MSKTLRHRINYLSIQTVFGVGVIVGLSLFIYGTYLQTTHENEIIDSLKRDAQTDSEKFISSFLLKEQLPAIEMETRKIKDRDHLNTVAIENELSAFRTQFKSCSQNGTFEICTSKQQIGVAFPIQVGEQRFGFLTKIKENDGGSIFSVLTTRMWMIGGVLLLALGILVYRFTGFTSKEIPSSLDALVNWLDNVLTEQKLRQAPVLNFEEFNRLGKQIATLVSKHDEKKRQALVGQLASGILHDFRNRLQPIVSAQNLVNEQDLGSEKRQTRLENLNSVLNANLRDLVGLIDSILDVNRDIRPKMDIGTSIVRTLDLSVADISDTADKNKTEISFEKPNELPTVPHDPKLLRRVFNNLLLNAVEAQKENIAASRKVNVKVISDEGRLRVIIDDNGPGIKLSEDHLFEPFKTTKEKGTGLGLFNAKKIVEAHGGTIIAGKSKYLRGASIEVDLMEVQA